MQCDIIIPIFNKADLTRGCLKSIGENTRTPHNLILIDNGSDIQTRSLLQEFSGSRNNVTLIRNEDNLGWVKAVNQGLKSSRNPYILIMNNDTIVKTENWLSKLINVAELSGDIGLVNPCFELKKTVNTAIPFIEVDFCRGYCVLIKRSVVEKIGLLDEAYGMGYYDDDDFSVRAIRAGFRCVRANGVFVEHIRDSTFSLLLEDSKRYELHEKNKQLFYSKWNRRLNLVFIVTRQMNREKASSVLFSLARKQHIIYLWNLTSPLSLPHINIRESMFPRFFSRFIFPFIMYSNKTRKKHKRYNLIFVDDGIVNKTLSKIGSNTYNLDIENDGSEIAQLVDEASRPLK